MPTYFVDTNIFLRHLTGDDPGKARACLALFQRAQRKEIALTTAESVIAEVVYVLSSKQLYNVARQDIRALLYPLLTLPGLRLTYRKSYLRALDLYATHSLDFADALIIAQMERQQIADVYSYDRDFDRIATINRVEP